MINTSQIKSFLTDYNRITRELLNDIYNRDNDSNAVCSTFSLYMLLAILLNATSGVSRQEILDAIGSEASIGETADFLSALQKSLTKSSNGSSFKSSNGICVDTDYFDKLNPEFITSMTRFLEAEFFEGVEDMVSKVNAWVRAKTDGMIDSILNYSHSDLKIVLMNAVTFDAEWHESYEEYAVNPHEIFTNIDGSTSKVTMLESEEHEYIEDDYYTGFVKPYKGKHFTFMGLLPRRANSKNLFGKSMQHIDFCKYYEQRIENDVDVTIPEFEVAYGTSLDSFLKNLGIQTLFSPEAQFDNMISENPRITNSILQKAYLKLDRHGTKAAAVTEMAEGAGCPDFSQRKTVCLNRPFVYAIIDTDAGIPLFTGFVSKL